VKLTDFGISKALEGSIAMCMTYIGTFKYMSPERVQSKKYSYPADIWSLGLVLMECATGKFPYPACHSYIDVSDIFNCLQTFF
jgi:serine/threonine protein kinase